MTEDRPLVSVVLPTHDRPGRLRRSLNSVIEQTYRPLEVIIVDDCSPIPAEEVIEEVYTDAECQIHVVRHSQNRGANAARNSGLESATGDFIAFLDDDDVWHPEKTEKQIEALRVSDTDCGLVYCEMAVLDRDNRLLRTTKASHEGNVTKPLLLSNFIGSFSTVMVRRKVVDDVGFLDEQFESWQDQEWYIRVSRQFRALAVSEVFVNYYVDTDDRLTDDIDTLIQSTYPQFIEKFRPIAAEFGLMFERKMLAWAAFRVGGWYALPRGQRRLARQHICRAIILYPFSLTFYPYLALSLLGPRATAVAATTKRWFNRHFRT